MKKEMIMKVILIIITMITIVHRNNYKNKKKPKTLTTKKREREREETKFMETDWLKNLSQPQAFVRVCPCVLAKFFSSIRTKGNSKLYKTPTNTYRC